jgi:hypothetical protein
MKHRNPQSAIRNGVIMTVDQWLEAAQADADRRGLPALKPLLETLARMTKTLRAADFNDRADAARPAGAKP